MRGETKARRDYSTARLTELRERLSEAESITGELACVYATGSYGRVEANKNSDLDVFIVGLSKPVDDERDRKRETAAFPRLEEIRLKSKLIEVSRELEFDDFSGDGEYLVHYPLHDFVGNLGRRQDDSANTFTARLLLLLESRCLLNQVVYDKVLREVIAAYWQDFEGHEKEYVPGFLTNDILRLWRTFCVNYEANTQSDPKEKKAKRQIKHYKLQHSRLLTCFSGIIHLLSVSVARSTVTPEDGLEMIQLTPLERISRVAEEHPHCSILVGDVLNAYDRFLQKTASAEHELIGQILSKSRSEVLPANHLSEAVFELIQELGQGNRLHRQIVV